MSTVAQPNILITGANGFVGRHLIKELRRRFGPTAGIYATSLLPAVEADHGPFHALDVTDQAAVNSVIAEVVPSHVVHLAGVAAVSAANANAQLAWNVHLFGALTVANAVLTHVPHCTMLSVGSGQVYGASARSGLALSEATMLAPTNVYEVTKAAADLALGALACAGLKLIRLRPFNHTGPGQTLDFAIPSFAMQIARIEAGLQEPIVRVGNLDAERDFVDVRDVTRAYGLAVEHSATLPPNVIFNIASGTPRKIRDLLEALLAQSQVAIIVETDPARMRGSDTPRFVGDASLAERHLGWTPQIPLTTTLTDVLDDCRRRVAQA